MVVFVNMLKYCLVKGEVVNGIWFVIGEFYLVEVVVIVGFDWLLIDGEYVFNDLCSISVQFVIVCVSGLVFVVWLVSDDFNWIKMVLDVGVQMFLILMVNIVEQVCDVVCVM